MDQGSWLHVDMARAPHSIEEWRYRLPSGEIVGTLRRVLPSTAWEVRVWYPRYSWGGIDAAAIGTVTRDPKLLALQSSLRKAKKAVEAAWEQQIVEDAEHRLRPRLATIDTEYDDADDV